MTSRARRLPSPALWRRRALASLGTALAIGVVCAVALSSLANTAAVTRVAVTQQLALIDDAAAGEGGLYRTTRSSRRFFACAVSSCPPNLGRWAP